MNRLSSTLLALISSTSMLFGCGAAGGSSDNQGTFEPETKSGQGGSGGSHAGNATGGAAGKGGTTSNPGTGGSSGHGDTGGSSGHADTGGSGGAPACTRPSPDAPINQTAPEGTKAPDPPAYSGGQLPQPVFAPGGHNKVVSGGLSREFIVVAPELSKLCPGEQIPVVFYWHALGEDPDSFASNPAIQQLVDAYHLALVIPVSAGATVYGFDTKWPFDITQSPGRMAQEFAFFDDMYASVVGWLPVNRFSIGSAGVSAGGLFNGQLQQARSEYLSVSFVVAGGTGGVIRPWSGSSRKTPSLVAWGGPSDVLSQGGFTLDFNQASLNLETGLANDGHFLVECIHDCGHQAPDVPPSTYLLMYRFLIDHPLWLGAGQSPYTGSSLPAEYPLWCGAGKGSAQNVNVGCN